MVRARDRARGTEAVGALLAADRAIRAYVADGAAEGLGARALASPQCGGERARHAGQRRDLLKSAGTVE
jgi:hypothetical protein